MCVHSFAVRYLCYKCTFFRRSLSSVSNTIYGLLLEQKTESCNSVLRKARTGRQKKAIAYLILKILVNIMYGQLMRNSANISLLGSIDKVQVSLPALRNSNEYRYNI